MSFVTLFAIHVVNSYCSENVLEVGLPCLSEKATHANIFGFCDLSRQFMIMSFIATMSYMEISTREQRSY